MDQNLLNDFKRFLKEYRESWNSLDAERMSAHQSKDLIVRWANPDAEVSDWGADAAKEGWYQAYKQFEGRNPKWHFEDLFIDINSQQEGVAVFLVTFELDGSLVNSKLLFAETFRQEQGEWKKIREYVENGFSLEQKSSYIGTGGSMMNPPKHIVSAATVVLNDHNELLLIKGPLRGWEMPGGQVEEGESPREAAIRETKEESGIDVEVLKFCGIFQNVERSICNTLFLCKSIGGKPTTSPESLEVGFFPIEEALKW